MLITFHISVAILAQVLDQVRVLARAATDMFRTFLLLAVVKGSSGVRSTPGVSEKDGSFGPVGSPRKR